LISQLLRSIREYKKSSILTPVFVIIEVFLEVLIPFLMANLIDEGINAGDMDHILTMGLVLVLTAALALIFGSLSGFTAAKASAGFAKNLRHDIFHKVQEFSFQNIDHFSTAGIVTRLTTDVTNIQNAYQMLLRIAVRAPIMLIFALIMAFRVNSSLATVFVIVIPFLALGIFLLIRFVLPIFDRVFETYDKLNQVVQENLRGIRVVKSYGHEEFEQEKFGAVSQSIYYDFSKAERVFSFVMPLMQLGVYGCMIAISWIGAGFIVEGSMTTGELMSMFSYVMMILMSLMFLAMVLVMLTISKASSVRITEILTAEVDLRNPPNPINQVKDGSIVFEQVSFSYGRGKRHCLSNVNLSIASGETIGIIGGTGSSKTTLVQLIARLYDTSEGRVLVGGVDVRDYDLTALRNAVAMVLQKNTLFSGTIAENLRWGNEHAQDAQLADACMLAQAHDFVSQLPDGYNAHVEQGGTNFSGGQRQRLCIARALLKNPKILILDDSTSAVDTQTDALLRQAFYEKLPLTTKLIVSQRISSIQSADRILVMDGGRIDGCGTHEQLLQSNNIYREVYESQTKGADAS